jgi:uncharacterized protein YodC (DUF2158 family)
MSETVKQPSLRGGDIVRLKSGRPPMTISDHNRDVGIVFCGWFWRGRCFGERFGTEQLELVRSTGQC